MTGSMNPMKEGMPVYALSFAISLLFVHVDPKNVKMKMHNKTHAMKQEIKKHIPIGTAIDEARRIMEANGFKCQLMERSDFGEREGNGPLLTDYHGIDFSYCDKERGGWWCDRRWQIAIVHKNGIVSDILVSIGLTCP